MKLLDASGLRPITRIGQSPDQAEPRWLKPRSNDEGGIVRTAINNRQRRTGLSPAGIRMMKIVSHGSAPGRPRGLIRAWVGWERVAHGLWPTAEIPGAPHGLLRMRLRNYRGAPVILREGIHIAAQSLVGELHCNNEVLLRLAVEEKANPYRACREDLRSLAAWSLSDNTGVRVQAFYGRTMLAVGGTRLGFEVREVPWSMWLSLEWFFMIGLLLLYTNDGLDRLSRGTTVLSYPKEVWISRERLIRLYGHQRTGRRPGYSPIAAASGRTASSGSPSDGTSNQFSVH